VVLRSGLFAGKTGKVVGVKRGRAEVAVGAMTVTVPVSELATR